VLLKSASEIGNKRPNLTRTCPDQACVFAGVIEKLAEVAMYRLLELFVLFVEFEAYEMLAKKVSRIPAQGVAKSF
jgi:hypothetical protein